MFQSAVTAIPCDMLFSVVENMVQRMRSVVLDNGGHIECSQIYCQESKYEK